MDNKRRFRWWNLLLFLGVLCLLGVAEYWLIYEWPRQVAEKPNEVSVQVRQLQHGYRSTGVQLLLAVAVLAGVVATFKRIRAVEEQAESARQQVGIAQRQQITERFSKAIEQLGSDAVQVRHGGIYALEKIAQDEPQAYFSLFREVLSAFVRETAREARHLEDLDFPPLPTDVQAALTVLGRNPPPSTLKKPAPIDWSGAYLECADLNGARLENAVLLGTHLFKADLFDANLRRASLGYSHLVSACLGEAHLGGADLFGADLRSADLYGAHLEDAEFLEANLTGANLETAMYSEHTVFPYDFTPPESAINVDA